MLVEKIAASGMRLTPQRLAIVSFLDGNTGHPSAEEIFHTVRKRYPTMSFATVYNTLEAMQGIDALRELKIDASRRRYDPNTKRHHHLMCSSCGRIVDIHEDYQLALPAQVSEEFEVIGNHVEFFGVCRPCRERAPGVAGRSAQQSNVADPPPRRRSRRSRDFTPEG